MNRLLKLKRTWTAAEADEWTKEDVVAAALAVVCFVAVSFGTPYAFVSFGTPYAFLLRPVGFLLLGGGILAGLVMLWLIRPKLDAVSADYEKKQARYLEKLEKVVKWEDVDE